MNLPNFPVLSLLFILLHLSSSHAQCPRGSYRSGSTCTLCPKGTYGDRPNARSCTPCRAGTYNPYEGGEGSDVCRRCPDNTTGTKQGAGSLSDCTPCPPGKVSDGFTFPCRECPPGTATPGSADVCVKCDRATYQRGNECVSCPYGKPSAEGSHSIDDCKECVPPTVFRFNRCETCYKGSFYQADVKDCRRCHPGTFSATDNALSCTPCPAGTASTFRGASECKPCPEKYVAVGPGAGFCRRVGGICPPGYHVRANGDCVSCSPGFFFRSETESCIICPHGTISAGGLVPSCTACPAGEVATDDGDKCVCGDGRERRGKRCVRCAKGYFKRKRLFDDFDRDCLPCPPDTFARRKGMAQCESCPEDKVGERDEGSRSCKTCEGGLVIGSLRQYGIGRRCVIPSKNCPPNFRRSKSRFGGTFCKANSCPSGFFRRKDGRCWSCKAGERPDGSSGCQSCPSTKVSTGGAARCTKCTKGFVRDAENPTQCICGGLLALGKGLNAKGKCAPCSPGTFHDGKQRGVAVCKPCPAGTRSWIGRDCFKCGVNEYAPVGSSACRKCAEGTYSYGLGEAECYKVNDE